MELEQKIGKSVVSRGNFFCAIKPTREIIGEGEGGTPIHKYKYGWPRPRTGQYLSRTALAECKI